MNRQNTKMPSLDAVVTAHRANEQSLILVNLTAGEPVTQARRKPLEVALVIDRSGSMQGQKLMIAKTAVANFIRSLDPEDRVALIVYDDEIELVRGLAAPSDALVSAVERIEPGGRTNLFGGWLMGAKAVGRGGRVVLLSDGLANVGRCVDAASISSHAAQSYERYGVTTTSIGVGSDYDEGLMAGMARRGGGAHYFASTAEAISDAFSQERYSAGSVFLSGLSLRCNGRTEQLGHFWSGETKGTVFEVGDLAGLRISVRYMEESTGITHTEEIHTPGEFGYSEEVKLEYLLQRASEAEGEMLQVRDPESAKEMKIRLRSIVLELLEHPKSDEPGVSLVIDRLKASVRRLEALEQDFDDRKATMHRKRSMQASYNIRERAKAYSSFEDDRAFVVMNAMTARETRSSSSKLTISKEALLLAPLEEWIRWEAMPLETADDHVIVAFEDPRRGFMISEIEKRIQRRVAPVFAGVRADEIVRRLKEA